MARPLVVPPSSDPRTEQAKAAGAALLGATAAEVKAYPIATWKGVRAYGVSRLDAERHVAPTGVLFFDDQVVAGPAGFAAFAASPHRADPAATALAVAVLVDRQSEPPYGLAAEPGVDPPRFLADGSLEYAYTDRKRQIDQVATVSFDAAGAVAGIQRKPHGP